MRLSKTLLIIATATVALAKDAIISRGLFIGKDTTLPGARGLEVYEDPRNHATAAASILKYIATKSNYNPQSLPPAKAQEAHKTFIEDVRNSIPYYVSLKLDGGFADLQNKIEKKYPFEDKATIARQLRYAFPVYNKQNELRRWEVSLLLIRKPHPENEEDTNTPVTVELISLSLELNTHANGEVDLPSQRAVLVVEPLELDAEFLKDRAQTLFDIVGVTTIKRFGEYFRSRAVSFPNLREWYQSGKPLQCDQDIF
ncbi:hypothetical protein BGW41_007610 [Actinomortierella wolfii]|nr:hypothetical protein BGW41_007610 [Actinomortierella wolfii]